jgi:FAD dependent oxidoreductase
MIGENYDYTEASYQTRNKIIKAHELYTKGLLYFMGHDSRVPAHIRSAMLNWGYPRDEFRENGHWPTQLYIREARRMIGEYVMTQANCQGRAQVDDAVGMAAYMMDSHNCQRIVIEKDGVPMVKNEGDVEIGGFPPYGISYRALVPKRSECTNLLVPVCLSASHIAFGSIRMEPVFMVLAQSAAMAAVQALEQGKHVQDIDVQKLQTRLKRDPLADGSPPEILVDNDIIPDQVQRTGRWQEEKGGTAQLGGSYARSLLMSDSTDMASSVKFMFPRDIKGKYRIYYYNAGNPVYKAAHYEMAVQLGVTEVRLVVPTSSNHFEWIPVGQFDFNGSGPAWLAISRKGQQGAIFADAVLLVPVDAK